MKKGGHVPPFLLHNSQRSPFNIISTNGSCDEKEK
jgi:hypothetical protein